jgi:uncharacterized protein (TIGR03083 family)
MTDSGTNDTSPTRGGSEPPDVGDPRQAIQPLRRAHERLARRVATFGPDECRRPSFCAEWNVAQVLSHMGSQAQILSMVVDAGLHGQDPPTAEAFPAIWNAWNAKTPEDQVRDGVALNGQILDQLDGLSSQELETLQFPMFGRQIAMPTLLRMRLSEVSLHGWDVEVAFDPSARIPEDAVELIIDGLGETAARAGKPSERPATIDVTTNHPRRDLVLMTGGVSLQPAPSEASLQSDTATPADGSLELPAELLVRLVAGRLGRAGHLGRTT